MVFAARAGEQGAAFLAPELLVARERERSRGKAAQNSKPVSRPEVLSHPIPISQSKVESWLEKSFGLPIPVRQCWHW
jgi:hypothetical protein